ncbi:MAG: hypothetical protein GY833_21780 [Aestuariibacter sp.]|nr:hypothetical protein [Aestuariibacter sp.]
MTIIRDLLENTADLPLCELSRKIDVSKLGKADLERMERILDRLTQIEKRRIEKFQDKNPHFVLMGANQGFLSADEIDMQRKLAAKVDSIKQKARFGDRGMTATQDLAEYNKLVAKLARLLKVSRSSLRELTINDLRAKLKAAELEEAQKYTSAATSINSANTPKVYSLVANKYGWQRGTRNLDLGGGRFDTLTQALKSNHGVTNLILDPYNRSDDHNKKVRQSLAQQRANTITISNVLNVIKELGNRKYLLDYAKKNLAKDGKVFITVHEGDKTSVGKVTGDDQYQLNRPTDGYMKEIQAVFPKVERFGQLIVAELG